MIKTCVLTILCSFFFTLSHAQEITFRKDVFRGNKFYQEGELISMRKMVDDIMIESSPEQELMKKALFSKNFSRGLLFASGFIFGAQLGGVYRNQQTTYIIAGSSVALIMASIPLKIDSNKKSVKALDLYNSSLGTIYEKQRAYNMYVNLNANGIGLKVEW